MISRRDLLKAGVGLAAFPYIWLKAEGHGKKGHQKMPNGLLVPLYEYWKLLDVAAEVNGNNLNSFHDPDAPAVTFGAGPVVGEGAAVFINQRQLIDPELVYANQYLWCPSNANLQFGDRAWEITFWWQWHIGFPAADPYPSVSVPMMKGDDNSGIYEWFPSYLSQNASQFLGTDNLFTTNSGEHYYTVSNGQNLAPDTWQFVDQWYDPDTHLHYQQIDGGAITSTAGGPEVGTLDVTDNPFALGGWGGTDGSDGYGALDGKIASVARFNTLLTTDQRALLAGGLPFSQFDNGGGGGGSVRRRVWAATL